MMSRLRNVRGAALLLSALLMVGVLSGCDGGTEVPTDEPQEPMDTGPMANDGQATRDAPGDGVTE